MKVVLVAEEAAGVHALRRIAAAGHEVHVVLTGAQASAPGLASVAAVARELGVPVREGSLVRDPDFGGQLREAGVDLLVNVHSLRVIRGEVLAAPAIGCFNLHPGPLPEYAGLNTVSWALYHGEREHGTTLHWMVPGIDEGDIAYAHRFPIDGTETGGSLMAKCVRAGMELLDRLLARAATDPARIPRAPQDLTRRRYFGREVPGGGAVDWRAPASAILRLVRACDYGPFASPWGKARTTDSAGKELRIVRVEATGERAAVPPGTVAKAPTDGVMVATGDDWVVLRSVESDGRVVDPREALRVGSRLGAVHDG
jgi:UDP-4-amino-4-deoxy-L-arabinose formyltransferase/UDP-glucuronic acid dehydrogenase (UDP-4-keto-hexauronic acid decarboxylating)